MFPILPIETPAQLHAYTKVVVREVITEMAQAQPNHITYQEAMKELGCGYATLRKRIGEQGIRTYPHGKKMAFDRSLLYKLQ